MGKVYLVGAGPGDPELITLKGLRAIRAADVILYDRLVSKELLQEAKDGAELIFCGKLPHYHTMKQETINRFLIKYAGMGKTVTRLKGGDPFVFGRGAEEALELARRGITFEIVPGVTSGLAGPAYAGIPVTDRRLSGSVAFVAGHRRKGGDEANWDALARGVDTLVIYMGVKNLPDICHRLLAAGLSEKRPVAIVENGTFRGQRVLTTTLGRLAGFAAEKKITAPALFIIGEVVRYQEQLQWFLPSAAQAQSG